MKSIFFESTSTSLNLITNSESQPHLTHHRTFYKNINTHSNFHRKPPKINTPRENHRTPNRSIHHPNNPHSRSADRHTNGASTHKAHPGLRTKA